MYCEGSYRFHAEAPLLWAPLWTCVFKHLQESLLSEEAVRMFQFSIKLQVPLMFRIFLRFMRLIFHDIMILDTFYNLL